MTKRLEETLQEMVVRARAERWVSVQEDEATAQTSGTSAYAVVLQSPNYTLVPYRTESKEDAEFVASHFVDFLADLLENSALS